MGFRLMIINYLVGVFKVVEVVEVLCVNIGISLRKAFRVFKRSCKWGTDMVKILRTLKV